MPAGPFMNLESLPVTIPTASEATAEDEERSGVAPIITTQPVVATEAIDDWNNNFFSFFVLIVGK